LDEEEEVDEKWSEILAKCGLDTLDAVGTVSNVTPWIADASGSVNVTQVELLGAVSLASNIASALEEGGGVFWRSEALKVSVNLRSALAFHDKTTSTWEVESVATDARMLRDHARLITGLLADFRWRPPNIAKFAKFANDPLYFVPSDSIFQMTLSGGYRLGLVCNEDNVVDDLNAASNTLLLLQAPSLEVRTLTRSHTFQPPFARTQYTVHSALLSACLKDAKSPASYALHARGVTGESGRGESGESGESGVRWVPDCLSAAALHVEGSYTSCSQYNSMDAARMDTAVVNLDLTKPKLLAHAAVLSALKAFIRNYFGSVSIAISRAAFEATERSDFEKAAWSPEGAIPGWNRLTTALQERQAASRELPTPSEQVLSREREREREREGASERERERAAYSLRAGPPQMHPTN
jgi:hypothetical protein